MDLLYWWFDISWRVLRTSYLLIAWNLFLAIIPLVLSVWLFRISERRSIFWWLIFAIFVAFLPNAPYILTDIIHYVKIARLDVPESVVIFTLTPQYFLFLLAGLQCYVMSLLNLGYYLERRDQERFILPVELLSHLLSAIGIYLGRFLRFNSWDFITDPDGLAQGLAQGLSHKQPILAIIVTFLILTPLYWLTKQINLGLVLRYQAHQADRRKGDRFPSQDRIKK
jgi:uncharacterized membrane protein